jgi:ribosomal protein L24
VDGPCKGQQGVVLAVLRQKKRIIVEGVNMVKDFF